MEAGERAISGQVHDLRPGDTVLISALAAGATLTAAAETAGMSARTARRRMNEPQFRLALEAAYGRALDEAMGRIGAAAAAAVECLTELVADGNPPGIRLGAAQAILRIASRQSELHVEELERRVAAIEGGARE